MKKCRDDIIAADPVYEGESWQSIGLEHLHEVCRQSINLCKQIVEPLTHRFVNLKSATPLGRKEEESWLMESLDLWFTRKWNNKRGADAKRAETPKKRKLDGCSTCGKIMQCVECDVPKVSPTACPFFDINSSIHWNSATKLLRRISWPKSSVSKKVFRLMQTLGRKIIL